MPGADFEDFYARTRDFVFSRANALAGDPHVALDATQEAYARMLERWAIRRTRSVSANQAYATTIARNLVIDRFRENGRLSALGDDLSLPCEDGSLEVVLDHASAIKSVRDAIDGLSERRRVAAILFFLEECTYSEIAEELGMAQSTVRTHVEQARILLRPLVVRIIELQRGGDSAWPTGQRRKLRGK